ncbi:uncharacterized protein LOC120352185 [Nilaparvata lugens]|uniref:uncharacterized protein LOC120352185 n=1 Tax=Nilaparvata lugens TaxID=108931 RepID=UPI00193D1B13|nr:uncharacterized protein LOC120352185 [Nilaparvata lugens]
MCICRVGNTVNTRLMLAVDVRGWGEVSDRQSRLDVSRALGTRHGSREFSQFIHSLTVCDRTSMKRKQHNPSILDFFKKKKSTSSSVDQQQANTTCSSSSELEQSFNTDPAPTTTGVSCLEPKPGPSGSNEAPAPTTTGVSCLEPKPGPSGSNKAPAPTKTGVSCSEPEPGPSKEASTPRLAAVDEDDITELDTSDRQPLNSGIFHPHTFDVGELKRTTIDDNLKNQILSNVSNVNANANANIYTNNCANV